MIEEVACSYAPSHTQIPRLDEPAVTKNHFNDLVTTNVSQHIEKKLNLSYVSWVYAWQELVSRFPESYYVVEERATEFGPVNYFTDGKTCWVKIRLVHVDTEKPGVDGKYPYTKTIIQTLPVMNTRNASIALDAVTSMDVNKAIQRCLAKAISMLGIGLYVYAGEDLPEEAPNADIKDQINRCKTIIEQINEKIRPLISNWNSEQKASFANDVIAPIIGTAKYTGCKDIDKLTLLLSKINEYAANNKQ